MGDGKILTTRDTPTGPDVTTSGAIRSVAYEGMESEPVRLKGRDVDGSGAIGVVVDTDPLADATARLVSYRNGGFEKAYMDPEGRLTTGAAWDDVLGPVSTASGLSAVTTEAWSSTNPFVATFMSSTQDDVLCWALQLPHAWNRGETRFHIHIVPMVDVVSPEVIRFDGSFCWAHPGTAIPATWTDFGPVSHTVSPGDALKPAIVPLFTSTPSGAWESDILMVRVRRPGSSDAADTYSTAKSATGGLTPAANCAILSADLHFLRVKTGTATEIPT